MIKVVEQYLMPVCVTSSVFLKLCAEPVITSTLILILLSHMSHQTHSMRGVSQNMVSGALMSGISKDGFSRKDTE